MNANELRKILQSVKNERRGGAPHEAWVKQNRDILMMQVRNTTDLSSRETFGGYMRHFFGIFVPSESLVMVGRAVGLFLLVIGTVFGGGLVSAQAYRDAAPGEMLYNMKLAVEQAQLLLAPNDDYRTRLHTEIADHRLDEIAKLAELPVENPKVVAGVLSSFGKEVVSLRQGLEKLRQDDPSGVAETAKLMERRMASYQNVLRQAGNLLPPALQPSVAQARDLVDGVTIAAMAVIVEKHMAGDTSTPRLVIENKFDDRIKQAEAKLDTAAHTAVAQPTPSPKAAAAKAAIAEAKELVKEQKYQAALTKMAEVAELTKEVQAETDQVVPAEEAPAPEVAAPAVEEAAPTVEQPAAPAEENQEETQSQAPVPAGSSETSDDAAGSGSR